MQNMLDRSRINYYLCSMNKLPIEKQVQVIRLLVEGNSLRSISRILDLSFNTVLKLVSKIGAACETFHNENVRNVKAVRVQADEIWSFVYTKEKHVTDEMPDGAGDVWTWAAIDADSKLIVSWFVGGRNADSAQVFMKDVASRLANRVQLTTDGHKAYLDAVEDALMEMWIMRNLLSCTAH